MDEKAILRLRKRIPSFQNKVSRDLLSFDLDEHLPIPSTVVDRLVSFWNGGRVETSEMARGRLAAFLGDDRAARIHASASRETAFRLALRSLAGKAAPKQIWVDTELVPFSLRRILAEEAGARKAKVVTLPITPGGDLDVIFAEKILAKKPRLLVGASPAAVGEPRFPTVVSGMCRRHKVRLLLVAHLSQTPGPLDVSSLGASALVTCARGLFSPIDLGIAWFQEEKDVPAPAPFAAEGLHGLDAALCWLEATGWDRIEARLDELTDYALAQLSALPGFRGAQASERPAGQISFVLEGSKAAEISKALAAKRILVKAGFHDHPDFFESMGMEEGALRVELNFLHLESDIDRLCAELGKIVAS